MSSFSVCISKTGTAPLEGHVRGRWLGEKIGEDPSPEIQALDTASGNSGTTANLAYDGQNHLVRWNDSVTTTNQERYLYDASGQCIVRRSQKGTGSSGTTSTLSVFGLEEHLCYFGQILGIYYRRGEGSSIFMC